MKKINLTREYSAIVDDEDFESISQFSWYAHLTKTKVYARRREGHGGPAFYMHKQILPGNSNVDHRDGDGLNNRRMNLRPCTQSQNMANQSKRIGTSSRYKGVSFFRRDRNWMAYLNKNGKRIHLGYHPTADAAAIAYNIEAKIQFGEFAKLNEGMTL